ncbi:MAG: dockerin type I repeat-containing protein [Oscillospiraceae bacterium]|nr:dockerin type I repeat-containing protein [Oscillospiraceae bacterium]
MMKKRLLAALTALFCVSSMAAMPVSALPHPEYFDHDGTLSEIALQTMTLIVETDGRELPEEELMNIEGYISSSLYDEAQYGSDWDNEFSIVPENTAYVISIENPELQMLMASGRSFMLNTEGIEAVYLAEMTRYLYGHVDYSLDFEMVDPDMNLDEITIPELSEFTTVYAHFRDVIHYQIPPNELGNSELIQSRLAEGWSSGQYRMYEYLLNYGQSIVEKYSDIFSDVNVGVSILESWYPSELSAASIWDTAGDLDTDGKIDASDAAELLALSAMKGATADGGYDPFTAEQKSAADLNGDTFCDANDAAYILQFAAEAGAGSTLSIGEFMTR